MDPQVGASFIPKRPLMNDTRDVGGAGLFMLVALLVFVASVVAAGAAFAYGQFLNNQIVAKSESLNRSKGAYDPASIDELIRIDSRINNAKVILQNHIAASAIFSLLSQETLANVQLTEFEYSLSDNGSVLLKLGGVANSFSTVALQSDQFGHSKFLHDVVFSGINVDQKGFVLFSVSATADPALISYAKNLKQQAATSIEQ